MRTLFLVDTENDDNLIPANPDKFLDGPDAASGEFGEEDHALDVIVFELCGKIQSAGRSVAIKDPDQFNICTHFRNLADLYHDEFVYFWVFLLIITHFVCCCREGQNNRRCFPSSSPHPQLKATLDTSAASVSSISALDTPSRRRHTRSDPFLRTRRRCLPRLPTLSHTIRSTTTTARTLQSQSQALRVRITPFFLLIFGALTRLIVFISLESFNPRSGHKLSHVPCRFYKMGACTAGQACQFSHTIVDRGGKDVCQWYIKGNCKFGHKCALAHVLPGQPMGMDRKNKKAAQLAGQAAGNQRASKNNTRSNTPQTQQMKEENGEETSKTQSQRVPRTPSKTVQGNISATAPSPHSSEEPAEELEKSQRPSDYPPINNTLPTPTETPPLPAAVSRPLTQRFSTRNTSSDLGYGPIGSPPNSSPARPAFQSAVQFSPGTSPHHRHALSTSPFAAGRASALTGFPDREVGLGHRPIQSASVLPRPIQRDSWQRQTGQTDTRTTALDSDEGDMEEFLPSSLNDLLTPEERKRRLSRSGSSKPAPTQANHQYSRSVPAAGLLDPSIWKDTATERELSTSAASVSFRGGFGSEGPSPSHFPGTSNASGAFLPQFHRSTNQSTRGFVSHSFDQDRDEVGVLPQLGASRALRYDNNGVPLGYGSNLSAALGSDALSPSARALQSHAPGQSLPQGLAAGLSRLHLVPPSYRGDLPDLSEISGARGLRSHTGSHLDATFGRSSGILPHANPVSASPRDSSVLSGMLRRQWPQSNPSGTFGHSGGIGQGSKEDDEPLFALDE